MVTGYQWNRGEKCRQEEADSRLRSARERVMLALGEAGPVCGWYEIEGGKRHLSDWEWRLDAHKKRASLPFRDRLSASFSARLGLDSAPSLHRIG